MNTKRFNLGEKEPLEREKEENPLVRLCLEAECQTDPVHVFKKKVLIMRL